MSGNLGGFPRENLPKGNVSGIVWGIIRKILRGMFLGKCMAVTFLGGDTRYVIRKSGLTIIELELELGGICLWKICTRM